ncbi:MAG: BON domain-containing protein [Pirellulales bacterium]|nr:BON domain-containing protein [Pirellulales bacterium]
MIISVHPQAESQQQTSVQQTDLLATSASSTPGQSQTAKQDSLGVARHRVYETQKPDADVEEHLADLVLRVHNRFKTRLPGCIRGLRVFTTDVSATDHTIVLTGKCNTFYTKQLAQHAAMGILEYERLVNNIDVKT